MLWIVLLCGIFHNPGSSRVILCYLFCELTQWLLTYLLKSPSHRWCDVHLSTWKNSNESLINILNCKCLRCAWFSCGRSSKLIGCRKLSMFWKGVSNPIVFYLIFTYFSRNTLGTNALSKSITLSHYYFMQGGVQVLSKHNFRFPPLPRSKQK